MRTAQTPAGLLLLLPAEDAEDMDALAVDENVMEVVLGDSLVELGEAAGSSVDLAQARALFDVGDLDGVFGLGRLALAGVEGLGGLALDVVGPGGLLEAVAGQEELAVALVAESVGLGEPDLVGVVEPQEVAGFEFPPEAVLGVGVEAVLGVGVEAVLGVGVVAVAGGHE